jgi:drug/metabolite transporter (DMT)-like permease
VVATLLGVQVAFASWSIVGKVTLGVVPAEALTFIRLLGGALAFSIVARLRRAPWLPPKGERGAFVLLALSGLVVNQLCFTWGLKRTSAVETTLLVAMIPVLSAAVAVLTGAERPARTFWVGLASALTGALMVARPWRIGAQPAHLFGDALVLINSASYAVYLVRGRAAFMKHGAMTVLGWIFPIAALCTAPLGLPELARTAGGYAPRTWAALAYVVLAATVFAYGGNAFALARAPSSLVAAFIYIQPALAMLFAVTLGDPLARWLGVALPNERLDWASALGMAAIFAGVWIATRRKASEGAKA